MKFDSINMDHFRSEYTKVLNADKTIDRLERDLRQAIFNGSLGPSTRLASVRSLAEQYGLTYGRTLRALKRLEKQGLLATRHGGGTYVVDKVAAPAASDHGPGGNGVCAVLVAPQNYWTSSEGSWYIEFIRGFESHLGKCGLSMKVIDKDEYIGHAANSAECRTHVVLGSLNESQLTATRARANEQTTFILAACDPIHKDWALVMDIDGPAGIRHAINALIERGHEDMVLLSWVIPRAMQSQAWWVIAREGAYEQAMRKARLKPVIVRVPFSEYVGASVALSAIDVPMLKCLKKRPRPTALICVNDPLARFVLDTCARNKVKVPDDVSVVGFDDDPWAVTMGLSTMHRPYRELGLLAGELAVQNQNQSQIRARWRGDLMIEPHLILRSSVSVPRL